ncbi:S-adenosyl-L-methionine-dependent methyltransferase [Neurospora hispaniola]|uniref:S-adenosyl-L-methionine-dependent methyltransferase n=1 Tax=Neurospora hispaniola TaxID=588809 RepID=A0AAJ0IAQ7_9PEZI|nr:S-adenosyl-L-methionine-dependent methyltransferase [Neurospora hispaniola]
MGVPEKRKAESPLSDAAASPKPTAPGPSSPGSKENSPTHASSSPRSEGRSPTPAPDSPAPELPGVMSGAHWLQQGLPETDTDDKDSTLGSDVESSTASISSSILNYRTINGRTYHSDSVTDGEYWAPNDQKMLGALEIYYHSLFLMTDKQLFQAPLKDNVQHAIDIGTGEGFWAIDFADKFPYCDVVGTDISPIQPTWTPPNLRFEIDDATKEWTFKENFFDYIHISFLNGAIEDWGNLYKNAYRCCKPGGWIEHFDCSPIVSCDDETLPPDSALATYGKILDEAGKRIGRSLTIAHDGTQEPGLKEAGFVNLHTKQWKQPLSPWPKDPKQKEIGLYTYAAVTSDLEGVIQFLFHKVMGWSTEEVAVFAAHMRQEMKEQKIHGYWTWKVVYGQKPEDAE